MLGGNPEFMAKHEMKRLGYDEDTIGLAVGSSTDVSEEILSARTVYRDLFAKYKAEIAPLAEQVRKAGGLFIIGTERHESRRIDNQLRGRSGRQGDDGESRFFLSLDDDLMRLFGSERIIGLVDKMGMEDDQPIDAKILSGSIESAQKRLEDQNFSRRKHVLEYDDVMNKQRKIIYEQRAEVLEGKDLKEKLLTMLDEMIEHTVSAAALGDSPAEWDFDALRNAFFGILCGPNDFRYSDEEMQKLTREGLIEQLTERAHKVYEEKELLFPDGQMREIERILLLRNVDEKWMEHLDAMDDLKGSIGLQAYAQRNPISEFKMRGADMFDEMVQAIRDDTVRALLSVVPRKQEIKRESVAKVTGEGFSGGGDGTPKKPVVKKASEKVGRNDPCPCGSGKKYKKCCGMNADEE